MNDYRRQQIHSKAMALLDEAGVSELPVDPKAIAGHLGIKVEAKPPHIGGASGWLIKAGEEFAIAYATHIPSEPFQRFSIAHELGHYWIDSHPEHVFKNGMAHSSHAGFGSADLVELEADYFAACLLMPGTMCKRLIWANRDGLAAAQALADAAKTSLQSAAIRYSELSRVPSAIVLSLEGVVEYCLDSGLRKESGWPRGLARGTHVPSGTATARLAQDSAAIAMAESDDDRASVADWFSGAHSEPTLIEEAIGLGAYGRVLTLLRLEEKDEDEADEEWEQPHFHR
jgi:hypothetical protein